jgi:hypothetical protein
MEIRGSSSAPDNSVLKIAIGGAVAVVLIIIVVVATIAVHNTQPAVGPPVAATDPNAQWVHQKAVECQGNMMRLSQADQDKLKTLYGFPGAPSIIANEYRGTGGAQ